MTLYDMFKSLNLIPLVSPGYSIGTVSCSLILACDAVVSYSCLI